MPPVSLEQIAQQQLSSKLKGEQVRIGTILNAVRSSE
jgi:hypothetical protein